MKRVEKCSTECGAVAVTENSGALANRVSSRGLKEGDRRGKRIGGEREGRTLLPRNGKWEREGKGNGEKGKGMRKKGEGTTKGWLIPRVPNPEKYSGPASEQSVPKSAWSWR